MTLANDYSSKFSLIYRRFLVGVHILLKYADYSRKYAFWRLKLFDLKTNLKSPLESSGKFTCSFYLAVGIFILIKSLISIIQSGYIIQLFIMIYYWILGIDFSIIFYFINKGFYTNQQTIFCEFYDPSACASLSC